MDMYSRDVLNKLLHHEEPEVQARVQEEIKAIEDLNHRINTIGVSESTMTSVIARIRKEVTGSYELKIKS